MKLLKILYEIKARPGGKPKFIYIPYTEGGYRLESLINKNMENEYWEYSVHRVKTIMSKDDASLVIKFLNKRNIPHRVEEFEPEYNDDPGVEIIIDNPKKYFDFLS